MPAPLGPRVHEKLIIALKAGASRGGAAAICGIGRQTLYDWLAADKAFAEECEQAEAFAETTASANIRAAGRKDWKAEAWWLEHSPRTKAAWRTVYKTETELSGPGGGPMQTGVIVYRPSEEEVRLYISALRELAPETVLPLLSGVELPALSSGIGEPEVVVLEPAVRTAFARARQEPEDQVVEVPPEDVLV